MKRQNISMCSAAKLLRLRLNSTDLPNSQYQNAHARTHTCKHTHTHSVIHSFKCTTTRLIRLSDLTVLIPLPYARYSHHSFSCVVPGWNGRRCSVAVAQAAQVAEVAQ